MNNRNHPAFGNLPSFDKEQLSLIARNDAAKMQRLSRQFQEVSDEEHNASVKRISLSDLPNLFEHSTSVHASVIRAALSNAFQVVATQKASVDVVRFSTFLALRDTQFEEPRPLLPCMDARTSGVSDSDCFAVHIRNSNGESEVLIAVRRLPASEFLLNEALDFDQTFGSRNLSNSVFDFDSAALKHVESVTGNIGLLGSVVKRDDVNRTIEDVAIVVALATGIAAWDIGHFVSFYSQESDDIDERTKERLRGQVTISFQNGDEEVSNLNVLESSTFLKMLQDTNSESHTQSQSTRFGLRGDNKYSSGGLM
jgi:hypothetical protein